MFRAPKDVIKQHDSVIVTSFILTSARHEGEYHFHDSSATTPRKEPGTSYIGGYLNLPQEFFVIERGLLLIFVYVFPLH